MYQVYKNIAIDVTKTSMGNIIFRHTFIFVLNFEIQQLFGDMTSM